MTIFTITESLPVKQRWQSEFQVERWNANPESHRVPPFPIRSGSQGIVLVEGAGITLDEDGFETQISLYMHFVKFTSNQLIVLLDLPWNVSTSATV